jgi:tetratricopeptide (TPR) repeat protein
MVNVEALLRTSLDDRYDIEGEVGRGGMSVVFRAHDLKHNRTVAIKVLRPELSQQIGAERFQREIEVVAGLTHPHILPLHDSGEAEGLLFYVMPFVEGGSLRERIQADGPLPEADALRITREMADALGYAHERDVIHRDVKPGNILLSGDHALLADFGVAHLASGAQETLTEVGIALGTPAYLSPEQASGEREIDGRSDIYSLGCVLYEALTGSPPFSGDSIRAMLVQQIVDTPPSVRSLNEGISPGAEAIVDTAISKEPDARFQTGEQMVQALDLAGGRFKGIPVWLLRRLVAPRRTTDRTRVAIAAATAVIVTVALFGLRGWVAEGGGRPDRAVVQYVVVPFLHESASEIERRLSRQAAAHLIDDLDGWSSVKVVTEAAMGGPTQNLRMAGLSQSSFAFGASLAQQYGADHLVRVQAIDLGRLDRSPGERVQGDVQISVTILDPSGREEIDHKSDLGPLDSLETMMDGMAMHLLELSGEPSDYRALMQRSLDHRAVQEYTAGQEALRQWRLAEAHREFEAAIARDSSFAFAHYLLAQTMYWEMSHDPERTKELGPRIDFHTLRAQREGGGQRLRPAERDAVDAFRAFWSGDYNTARERFDLIIESDSADIEALLLRGAVEMEDLILRVFEDGSYIPRQNPNVAHAMFDSAIALNPDWELSWGHLHDIARELAQTAYQGASYGFELPGADLVSPYQDRETTEQKWFCLVMQADTIAWIERESYGCPVDAAALAAAMQKHARYVELLERRAVVEEKSRHHEELAALLVWERSLSRCNAEPARSDSLNREALRHIEAALAIRGDTTPQDRIQLANAHLGLGDTEVALVLVEQALGEFPDWEAEGKPSAPAASANPFLAAGMSEQAARILERSFQTNSVALRDPQDSGIAIPAAGQLHTLVALQSLGALGESGSVVEQRLERLRSAWDEAPLSDRDRTALRLASLSYVGPALAHSTHKWDEWFERWEYYGLEVPPVWQGMFAADTSPPDTSRARAELDRVVREMSADPIDAKVRPIDLYVPLVLARRIGATDVEQELRRRLSRCALKLDEYDPGWGMRRSLGMLD